MSHQDSVESFLTVADVAELLKLNQQTVRNWIDQGSLPAVKVGRRVRIKRSDLDRLVEQGYRSAGSTTHAPGPNAQDFWSGEQVGVAEVDPAGADPGVAAVDPAGADLGVAAMDVAGADLEVAAVDVAGADRGVSAEPAAGAVSDLDGDANAPVTMEREPR